MQGERAEGSVCRLQIAQLCDVSSLVCETVTVRAQSLRMASLTERTGRQLARQIQLPADVLRRLRRAHGSARTCLRRADPFSTRKQSQVLWESLGSTERIICGRHDERRWTTSPKRRRSSLTTTSAVRRGGGGAGHASREGRWAGQLLSGIRASIFRIHAMPPVLRNGFGGKSRPGNCGCAPRTQGPGLRARVRGGHQPHAAAIAESDGVPQRRGHSVRDKGMGMWCSIANYSRRC